MLRLMRAPLARRAMRWVAWGGLVGIALAFAWGWSSSGHDAASVRLRPDEATVVARGATIYAARCASCHGVNGEGQQNWRQPGPDGLLPAPPHDASGHTWHHPDAQLFALTKHGAGKLIGDPNFRTSMPIFDGVLSDEDIVAVLSWIKAQWPNRIRALHDERNQQAAPR